MTDPSERSRIIGEVRAAWAATPSAHSMVLDAREVDALLEAAERPEPLTDVELVARYDAGWNGLDDGTVRVAVLEVAAIRAVYEAGRNEAPNHTNGSTT